MTSYRDMLDAAETAEDLQAYAQALYASGLLDASEQMTSLDPVYGWLAPWTPPRSAIILAEPNQADIILRLASGEEARWRNDRREWESCEWGEES